MLEIDSIIDSLFKLFTFTSISSYGVVKKDNYRMYEHIIGYYNYNKNFKFNFIINNNNLTCEYNQETFRGYKNINENIKNILLEFEIEKIEEDLKILENTIQRDIQVNKFLSSKFPLDIVIKIISIKK